MFPHLIRLPIVDIVVLQFHRELLLMMTMATTRRGSSDDKEKKQEMMMMIKFNLSRDGVAHLNGIWLNGLTLHGWIGGGGGYEGRE